MSSTQGAPNWVCVSLRLHPKPLKIEGSTQRLPREKTSSVNWHSWALLSSRISWKTRPLKSLKSYKIVTCSARWPQVITSWQPSQSPRNAWSSLRPKKFTWASLLKTMKTTKSTSCGQRKWQKVIGNRAMRSLLETFRSITMMMTSHLLSLEMPLTLHTRSVSETRRQDMISRLFYREEASLQGCSPSRKPYFLRACRQRLASIVECVVMEQTTVEP